VPPTRAPSVSGTPPERGIRLAGRTALASSDVRARLTGRGEIFPGGNESVLALRELVLDGADVAAAGLLVRDRLELLGASSLAPAAGSAIALAPWVAAGSLPALSLGAGSAAPASLAVARLEGAAGLELACEAPGASLLLRAQGAGSAGLGAVRAGAGRVDRDRRGRRRGRGPQRNRGRRVALRAARELQRRVVQRRCEAEREAGQQAQPRNGGAAAGRGARQDKSPRSAEIIS
jgi:hypothetical protein